MVLGGLHLVLANLRCSILHQLSWRNGTAGQSDATCKSVTDDTAADTHGNKVPIPEERSWGPCLLVVISTPPFVITGSAPLRMQRFGPGDKTARMDAARAGVRVLSTSGYTIMGTNMST